MTRTITHRRNRRPLLLDLTAMTDIAFVLLACFITIHVWSMPKAMSLCMPDLNGEISCMIGDTPITTVVLDNDSDIFTYNSSFITVSCAHFF